MAAITDQAYAVTSELFGPHAQVPGWAWLALLGMVFWGLLAADRRAGQPDAEPDE
jgi:hypothetical protein